MCEFCTDTGSTWTMVDNMGDPITVSVPEGGEHAYLSVSDDNKFAEAELSPPAARALAAALIQASYEVDAQQKEDSDG